LLMWFSMTPALQVWTLFAPGLEAALLPLP